MRDLLDAARMVRSLPVPRLTDCDSFGWDDDDFKIGGGCDDSGDDDGVALILVMIVAVVAIG